ncbi:MAG TPA: hypothetical protein VHP30_08510 [Ignavibacteriales bacterium]|nr:hypothetical protein [Ignavibacteriales bacterium]
MQKTAAELYKEKSLLICEFNNNSPLFARAADAEIEKNNLEGACRMLADGIKKFPHYSAAYYVLGKALILLDDAETAEKAFRKASELSPFKSAYNYYINLIEISGAKSSKPAYNISAFIQDTIVPLLDIEIFKEEFESKPAVKPGPESSGAKPIEDRLDELAEQLQNAKIPAPEPEFEEDAEEDDFERESEVASETLAKIFLAQANYKEAIKIYGKLKTQQPGKAAYFQSKIDEIKSQIDEGDWS